jgi:hypothetical protein
MDGGFVLRTETQSVIAPKTAKAASGLSSSSRHARRLWPLIMLLAPFAPSRGAAAQPATTPRVICRPCGEVPPPHGYTCFGQVLIADSVPTSEAPALASTCRSTPQDAAPAAPAVPAAPTPPPAIALCVQKRHFLFFHKHQESCATPPTQQPHGDTK